MNIFNENILSISEAAKTLPAVGGKRPSTSAVYRWTSIGVRGVKLETARIGRRLVTSREALARFASAVAEAPAPDPTPRPTTSRRRTAAQITRADELAQARLKKMGLDKQ